MTAKYILKNPILKIEINQNDIKVQWKKTYISQSNI